MNIWSKEELIYIQIYCVFGILNFWIGLSNAFLGHWCMRKGPSGLNAFVPHCLFFGNFFFVTLNLKYLLHQRYTKLSCCLWSEWTSLDVAPFFLQATHLPIFSPYAWGVSQHPALLWYFTHHADIKHPFRFWRGHI